MELLKRIYIFIIKLFSIKIALFVVATWALYHAYIGQFVWLACALLLVGGREIAKILASNLSLKK